MTLWLDTELIFTLGKVETMYICIMAFSWEISDFLSAIQQGRPGAQTSVLPPSPPAGTVPLQQWSSRDARASVTSGKGEQV